MQDLIPAADYGSCCLTLFNSCDDDDSAQQYGSYDDSYYLIYEEDVDDHTSQLWYKNQDYQQKEMPYGYGYGYGCCESWLRDYANYLSCEWGGNQITNEESNLGKEEDNPLDQGLCYNHDMHSENQEFENKEDDPNDLAWWDNWEGPSLYQRIFGY